MVAETTAHLLFQPGQMITDLVGQTGRDIPVLKVITAGVGGDDEPGRDGQPQVGHLGQVGALAAQQILQVFVALSEVIDELRHCALSSGAGRR